MDLFIVDGFFCFVDGLSMDCGNASFAIAAGRWTIIGRLRQNDGRLSEDFQKASIGQYRELTGRFVSEMIDPEG